MTIELVGPRMAVGRIDGNEIQIVHGSISSRHAELVAEGAEYRVRDLESTNGTRVNDEKVTEVLLQDRDRLQFGQIPFRYEGGCSAGCIGAASSWKRFSNGVRSGGGDP